MRLELTAEELLVLELALEDRLRELELAEAKRPGLELKRQIGKFAALRDTLRSARLKR